MPREGWIISFTLEEDAEAAVLAGGRSRRMGRDKAWLLLGGRPVIERVVAVLAPLFYRVRIIGGAGAQLASLGLPVEPDLRPGSGALGGLHAALATADKDVVFVAACDLPFLTAELVARLAARLDKYDAVVPWTSKGPDPLVALYRRRCFAAVERALDRKELRVGGFLDDLNVRRLEEDELGPGALDLFNLNTPEDYARAQALAQPNAGSATRSDGSSS